MENFCDVAKSAWKTDDGKTTFCVPMASVIHGFIYNKDIFNKLGLSRPRPRTSSSPCSTRSRRTANTAAGDGHRRPVGSRHHGLPEHRPQLLEGRGRPQGADRRHGQKFTDPPYVDIWTELASWALYGHGYQAQTYPDSQNLFTLGKAAIYPGGLVGHLDLPQAGRFEMGAFAPPRAKAGDTCYISDHTDIAMGMNAARPRTRRTPKSSSTGRSQEFADLYTNALPGFFSLSNAKVDGQGPGGPEFVGWRDDVQVDDPQLVPDPVARRAEPGERAVERDRAGDQRHHDARSGWPRSIQDGLDKWYQPALSSVHLTETASSQAQEIPMHCARRRSVMQASRSGMARILVSWRRRVADLYRCSSIYPLLDTLRLSLYASDDAARRASRASRTSRRC